MKYPFRCCLLGLGFAIATALPGQAADGSAAIKAYLLQQVNKMDAASHDYVANAQAYDRIIRANGGSYDAAAQKNGAELLSLVAKMQGDWVGWNARLRDLSKSAKAVRTPFWEIGALLGVGFLTVREGFETTIFMQSLVLEGRAASVLVGVLAGFLFIGTIGLLILVFGAKLPYRKLLICTGIPRGFHHGHFHGIGGSAFPNRRLAAGSPVARLESAELDGRLAWPISLLGGTSHSSAGAGLRRWSMGLYQTKSIAGRAEICR